MKNQFQVEHAKLKEKLLDIRSIVRHLDILNVEEYTPSKLQEIITAIKDLNREFFTNLSKENEDTVYYLRNRAKSLGVYGYQKMTKIELLSSITIKEKERNDKSRNV